MAKDPYEIPAEFRAVAARSIEEVRKAFDQVLNATSAGVTAAEDRNRAAQQGARDLGTTVMTLAQRNVMGAFDYMQKLVQAKDAQALMQLQVEFIRNQMDGLGEQAKILNEALKKAAPDNK
jgi:phasin